MFLWVLKIFFNQKHYLKIELYNEFDRFVDFGSYSNHPNFGSYYLTFGSALKFLTKNIHFWVIELLKRKWFFVKWHFGIISLVRVQVYFISWALGSELSALYSQVDAFIIPFCHPQVPVPQSPCLIMVPRAKFALQNWFKKIQVAQVWEWNASGSTFEETHLPPWENFSPQKKNIFKMTSFLSNQRILNLFFSLFPSTSKALSNGVEIT